MIEAIQTQIDAVIFLTKRPMRHDSAFNEECERLTGAAEDLAEKFKRQIEWMDSLCTPGFDNYVKNGRQPLKSAG